MTFINDVTAVVPCDM